MEKKMSKLLTDDELVRSIKEIDMASRMVSTFEAQRDVLENGLLNLMKEQKEAVRSATIVEYAKTYKETLAAMDAEADGSKS